MIEQNIVNILENNSYAGRGIIIGTSGDASKAIIAYFLMGRSSNSRNRIFLEDGDGLLIKAFDESKLEDPTLIIYSPLRVLDNCTIVTNGDQTDTIYEYMQKGLSFEEALRSRVYEPDAPNYTPRISGIVACNDQSFTYKMSILKKQSPSSDACQRNVFEFNACPGQGHFIHTYLGDGDPLPTFTGEPEIISLQNIGDIDDFTTMLWNSLNADNKVSLAVRYIDLPSGQWQTRIVNRNQ